MKFRSGIIGLTFAFVVTSASANDPTHRGLCWSFWPSKGRVCPPTGCCPDDYCRKPCPSLVEISRCGVADDYCRKPMPCVSTRICGGPDDYCRKPAPCRLCPPPTPDWKCGTPPTCGETGKPAAVSKP